MLARDYWCGNKQWEVIEGWVLHRAQAKEGHRRGSQSGFLSCIEIVDRMLINACRKLNHFLPLGIWRTYAWIYDCSEAKLWGESPHPGGSLLGKWLHLSFYSLRQKFINFLSKFCSLKTLQITMLLSCFLSMVLLILSSMMISRWVFDQPSR